MHACKGLGVETQLGADDVSLSKAGQRAEKPFSKLSSIQRPRLAQFNLTNVNNVLEARILEMNSISLGIGQFFQSKGGHRGVQPFPQPWLQRGGGDRDREP
mgnify:FL=1